MLAVGVSSGSGTFFDGGETVLGGILGQFKSTTFETANGAAAFGIIVGGLKGEIQLNETTKFAATALPFVSGDLNLKVL